MLRLFTVISILVVFNSIGQFHSTEEILPEEKPKYSWAISAGYGGMTLSNEVQEGIVKFDGICILPRRINFSFAYSRSARSFLSGKADVINIIQTGVGYSFRFSGLQLDCLGGPSFINTVDFSSNSAFNIWSNSSSSNNPDVRLNQFALFGEGRILYDNNKKLLAGFSVPVFFGHNLFAFGYTVCLYYRFSKIPNQKKIPKYYSY